MWPASWIEPWERQAIIDYFDQHPLEGYRRRSTPIAVPTPIAAPRSPSIAASSTPDRRPGIDAVQFAGNAADDGSGSM